MPIINQKDWDAWVKSNKSSYGKACVDVAREVMRIIDEEKPKALDAHKLISKADDNVKVGGITGFMAGAVAQMVSQCHSRGNEFREIWNKSYGVTKTKTKNGVVNPAIITISSK